MNTDAIINSFKQYLPLGKADSAALAERLIEKRIKRRHFVLQQGDICRHYSFVVQGCLKMYKVDDKGQEHNLQFAIENQWITDIGSFHSELPSELYIEALERSIILQISKDQLIYLYVNHPKFDRNFRVIIENAFVDLQKRVLQNISCTAEERYLYFKEKNPELFNRISNVQIASYIGVTPEFLSKIRRSLASR
ncbi:Crp/Fnr family transcriptional regulator [Poritiphilus flavus]|uniref:Cyclic nucleotide-binding domain-containing protein n=1 Tax=Poritiphilus flavus TaxID=2697053 RepID=A0A6L9E7F3_9FLAO|nr:Crp/Fnr family transcriptional regulator [Poritiphilus flavus]NAS10657.1 cyclic nucleotide-binding domain-containing protein [Poritiphilus flavus]